MANSQAPSTALKLLVGIVAPSLVFEPSEYKYFVPVLKRIGQYMGEAGYYQIQGTRPDSVGIGLNTSPLGLAAYVLEKFATFATVDNVDFSGKKLLELFTKDELLTDVSIYWFTGTITSSARFYKEGSGGPQGDFLTQLLG